MAEELQQAQEIYELIMTYLVTYGFQVLGAIIILLVGIFVAGKIAGMLNNLMLSKNIDITLSKFTASTVKAIIIVMIAIMALGQLGISVTPFVAAIGALSLGAGLALQGLLSKLIGIDNFGDSSININIRCWVLTTELFATKYRINLAVHKALTDNNIEIPFPQRDVHLIQESSA